MSPPDSFNFLIFSRALFCKSSLHFCSIIPRYCMMLLSSIDTPIPSNSAIEERSHSIELKTLSTFGFKSSSCLLLALYSLFTSVNSSVTSTIFCSSSFKISFLCTSLSTPSFLMSSISSFKRLISSFRFSISVFMLFT